LFAFSQTNIRQYQHTPAYYGVYNGAQYSVDQRGYYEQPYTLQQPTSNPSGYSYYDNEQEFYQEDDQLNSSGSSEPIEYVCNEAEDPQLDKSADSVDEVSKIEGEPEGNEGGKGEKAKAELDMLQHKFGGIEV
jgi:hypothetical protein